MKERPSFPISSTDARGQYVTLDAPPCRIVSLVPSQTELMAHLGLDDEVVGLTRFCTHPDGWKDTKQIVGGTKQVNVQRVKALDPDMILANLEENTREIVAQMDEIAPTYVTDVRTLSDALDMIRQVGRLAGRTPEADALAAEIDAGFATLPHFRPLRTTYLIWHDPYMTVGRDTFIHDVMGRAGFVNVFGEQKRYPEITPTDLLAARPDVVLLPDEPYPFQQKHVDELRTLVAHIPIHLVDGSFFSWYGSRLLQTPAYLHQLRDAIE